jgi:hypothetical protein
MLAKSWKTILLIICVVAVMFNLISKIVRAPSFQKNLDTVIEENIVSIDAAGISNSLQDATDSFKESASEITSTIMNTTSDFFTTETEKNTQEFTEQTSTITDPVDTEEPTIVEEQTFEEEYVEETTTNTENSKFKVVFN